MLLYITLPTKVCLVKAMVFSVVMYGCESWAIKKAERGGGPKMAEEYDGENTFSPTNSSKEHLNIE